MARVEWTRQSGDDVEAVVAMLICSMYPDAVRVRPSQGDGGIDVFVPGEAGFAKERAVYQVKKYAENLTSSQKRKIKTSFNRVVETSKKEGWRITEWHLVMPLDLTSQNLGWLDEITEGCGFPCKTKGLLFCDTQAANYPKIIDYYLRDGKDRLQAAMNNLTTIITGSQNREPDAGLKPGEITSDLIAIYRAINDCDPFYRYAYAVSDTPPPDEPGPEEPGLVAIYAMQQDSVWITIRIFALSRAAIEERPISWQFDVAIPAENNELHDEFQKFVDYGAPVTMPVGTVRGSLDLPGGLGGDISSASLRVLSTPDENGEEPAEFAIAMLPPDSESVIASTTMKRINLTVGQTGVRSIWKDKAELFTIEMLVAGRLQGQMNLQVAYALAGRRPAELVDSLKFLAAWHAPNRLAFGLTYGPPDFGVAATITDDPDREPKRWAPICIALTRLQDFVPKLLKLPTEMTKDEALSIIAAGKLVAGEAVSGTMSGDFTVVHREEPEIERADDVAYEFVAIKDIEFTLGGEDFAVGKQALFFRGRYVKIGDDESKIEPISDGVSIRYTGDLEVTRVLARNILGVAKTSGPSGPETSDSRTSDPSGDRDRGDLDDGRP